MVKICQTGLLKLNFETRPKKHIFRFLPKISAGKFLNPWALRVSGMGGYTSKCEKKSKSLHTNDYTCITTVYSTLRFQIFIFIAFLLFVIFIWSAAEGCPAAEARWNLLLLPPVKEAGRMIRRVQRFARGDCPDGASSLDGKSITGA
jgi:hypothetical protein